MPGMTDAVRQCPAISAHRGGSENAPGGTYRAYHAALAAGAEYVELDVRRTADGVLVARHRARTGWGRAVGSLSYARLCRLAGYAFRIRTVADENRIASCIVGIDRTEAEYRADGTGDGDTISTPLE